MTTTCTELDRAAALERERHLLLTAWNALERLDAHLSGGARRVFEQQRVLGIFALLGAGLSAVDRDQRGLVQRALTLHPELRPEVAEWGRKGGLCDETEADLALLRRLSKPLPEDTPAGSLSRALQLDVATHAALMRRASERGTSLRVLIAEAVMRYLEAEDNWRPEDL